MKTITVSISSSYRHYRFTDGKDAISDLLYPSSFSSKGEIKTADGNVYTIEPQGFFGQATEIRQNGKTLVSCKAGWNGHTSITHYGTRSEYSFRMKGLFNSAYILFDKHNRELLSIKQKFRWKSLRSSYEISLTHFDAEDRQQQLVLFLAFHCYKTMLSMAAAA